MLIPALLHWEGNQAGPTGFHLIHCTRDRSGLQLAIVTSQPQGQSDHRTLQTQPPWAHGCIVTQVGCATSAIWLADNCFRGYYVPIATSDDITSWLWWISRCDLSLTWDRNPDRTQPGVLLHSGSSRGSNADVIWLGSISKLETGHCLEISYANGLLFVNRWSYEQLRLFIV